MPNEERKMSDSHVKAIRTLFEQKSTNALKQIIAENDTSTYEPQTFSIVKEILDERAIKEMEQSNRPSQPMATNVKPNKLVSLPNALWLILFGTQFINIGRIYGFNAYSFGVSFGFCLIPLVFGVGWILNKGESRKLRTTYIIITAIFLFMLIFNILYPYKG